MQATQDEVAAIRCWAFDRLMEDGRVTPMTANVLVAAGVDYHRVLALLDAGCPPELAVEILT